MTRKEKAQQRKEDNERLEAIRAANRVIVSSGTCPLCGGTLRRNLSLTGWFQCEQLGAEGFRKDSSRPSCSWQAFV